MTLLKETFRKIFKKDPKRMQMLDFMKLAIKTEKKGIKFYSAAKKHLNDPNMNKFLDVLLEQENIHLEMFTRLYDAEKKKSGTAAIAAEYKAQEQLKTPLFGMKELNEIVNKKVDMYEIFQHAIKFEDEGYALYMGFAEKIKNPKIKKFLKMVAKEELNHKNFIMMHQEAIHNDAYWSGLNHVRLET